MSNEQITNTIFQGHCPLQLVHKGKTNDFDLQWTVDEGDGVPVEKHMKLDQTALKVLKSLCEDALQYQFTIQQLSNED
tara:strand:- start:865 stop:1098 length:234 start_codon:yes stop_codon:yes gene_type:complete